MRFHIFILLFLFITLPFAVTAVEYPMVSSVSPTKVKPGEIITLSGKNFAIEGDHNCTQRAYGQIKEVPCKYKTVIGAYRITREPTSGIPDFTLEIVSLNANTVQARIPATITSGDGQYNIGYNAQFSKDAGPGYGEILVGFGRYDMIEIYGTGRSTPDNNPMVTKYIPTHLPTRTVAPTVKPVQPESSEEVNNEELSFFSKIVRILFKLFK